MLDSLSGVNSACVMLLTTYLLHSSLLRGELTALLAHELAHLARYDTAWLWIGRVLCSCLAFQPLNFLARRRWQKAAECRCDDWAVRHAVDRFSLARCLTQVAEWRLGQRVSPAMLAASGAQSNLSDRVERLVGQWCGEDPWTGRFRRRAFRCAGLGIVILLVGWGPAVVWPAGSAADDRQHEPVEIRAEADPPTGRTNEVITAIASEFDAVQVSLELLQQDIDQLNQVLQHSPLRPETHAAVQCLKSQMGRLRDRRDSLTRLLNHFQKEFEL